VSNPKVGDRVVIERDENLYPSKGTWPRFRGKTGTIVEVNLGEYGVVFTKVRKPRSNGSIAMADAVWFQPHEVRVLAPALAPTGRVGATKQSCRVISLSRKLPDASVAYCRSGNGPSAVGQPCPLCGGLPSPGRTPRPDGVSFPTPPAGPAGAITGVPVQLGNR